MEEGKDGQTDKSTLMGRSVALELLFKISIVGESVGQPCAQLDWEIQIT